MKRYGKVNLEISNICNLQCSFCPEVVRAKRVMDPALFRRVIEQVAPLAEQVCLHLMGDPLVHPQLEELVAICREHRAPVFLVTNGVLLRERQAELLLDPAFRQVCFSLHSYGDNYPERDPAPYLERIFSYTERALRERPELYINFRLWNLPDLSGVKEANVTGDGEGRAGDAPAQASRGTKAARNLEILHAIEARFGVVLPRHVDVRSRKSHRITPQGRLYLHFDTEFVWPALELPVLGERGRCYGLKTHFGVLVDGTVVPCCLDKEGAIPLGSALETPISEILASPRARRILDGFARGKLVEDLCQRCQYIERFA